MSLERTPFKIELPPNTLLLAERVQEQLNDVNIFLQNFDKTKNSMNFQGQNTRKRSAIYIIDAYFIANENMLFQNGRPIVFMDR